MTTMADLTTKCSPNWCPGCGNLPLWTAFKKSAVAMDWNNNNSVIVAGIGCHGHIINFTKMTSFEGLHGRALPVASGIKMVNSRLNVFVFTGDGDCLGEGGNHFIHACRRNHNINIFLHDNGLYALTTGQTSPASPSGYKSKSTPLGNPDNPLNPLALAIASGATFVARCYSSDIAHVSEMMVMAAQHNGVSVVDIMQPCITFNKEFTHEFFQKNIYHLDESYDSSNKLVAFEKAQEFGINQIPVGILYKEEKPSYEDHINHLEGHSLLDIPLERNTSELFFRYV